MKLNLIAPINNLGYGYTGLHITDELIKAGHDVALFPIGKPECHFRHQENIQKALDNANTWDNYAPCVRLWHQHDMSMFVGKGLHVGFPIFELDTLTDKEIWHLQSCDELFVCSEWAREVCYNNFSTPNPPIGVVPLGVEPEIFEPTVSRRKPTIFLNVGKWEKRKGHDILIDAFNHAFTPDDNVELWMMCDNPFLNEEQTREWRDKYGFSPLGNKVRFIPRVEADTQVAEIMQQADCGVFPSRGEGWNLEALEMLSCGKQVIATDYSAHTEFLNEDNTHLVPMQGIEPAKDDIWFHGQGNWGKFTTGMHRVNEITGTSMLEMVIAMRYVHELKQKGELGLNVEGIETAEKLTWANTANKIIQFLS